MVAGRTAAPNLLTEADLISLMDKHGIGTDATHADHIEKIKSRMYVGLRNDLRLIPGHLGLGLVEGYDEMGFHMSKPRLRSELEADLKRICEGRMTKDDVLRNQIAKYRDIFLQTERQIELLGRAVARNFRGVQVPVPGVGGGGGRGPGGGGGGGRGGGGGGGPGGGGGGDPGGGGGNTGNHPPCKCGISVLRQTKQGQNEGRKFFACAKGRDEGCGFFQWEDEPR